MIKRLPPLVTVVDDDDAFRDSLSWLLQNAGYRVAVFAMAELALAQWDSSQHGCLLVDIRMPGMNGLEFQDEMQQRHPGAALVFVTGHGDIPMAVRAMQNGAVDFLEKPFDEQRLLAAIARALACDARRHKMRAQRDGNLGARASLTNRERQVMEAVIAGRRNKVIADELGLSIKTVEVHRARMMRKLGVTSTAELVRLALLGTADS